MVSHPILPTQKQLRNEKQIIKNIENSLKKSKNHQKNIFLKKFRNFLYD